MGVSQQGSINHFIFFFKIVDFTHSFFFMNFKVVVRVHNSAIWTKYIYVDTNTFRRVMKRRFQDRQPVKKTKFF